MKDILAMANTGGGFIVVGVEEIEEGFSPVGLTSEQVESWETTRLNQFVAGYAEPPINATLGKEQIDDSTYVFIGVPEFPDVPHICKKEYPDVLTAPTLYIRTDDNNSAPISRVSDMNSLIERGVRKRGDAIVDTVGHVLSTGVAEPQPSAVEQFEGQADEALARFKEKSQFLNQFEGWREMVAFPATSQPGRTGEILDALKYAEEEFTGWPFINVGRHGETYAIADGYESQVGFTDFVGNQREYFWQVHDSGLFFHRELMPEETWSGPRWISEVLDESRAGCLLDLQWTLQYVTIGIRCASRLYEAVKMDDDPITIRFQLTSTEGRTLVTGWPIGRIVHYTCRIPQVIVEKSEPLDIWRSSTPQMAAEIVTEICQKFNVTDIPIDQFRDDATKLLERRLP